MKKPPTRRKSTSLPKQVTLVEVSPRDGLQNIAVGIPTAIKVEYINRLSKTGLRVIETTSFVSPKAVPQLADHEAVMRTIQREPGVRYPVLVPNQKGLDAALDTHCDSIAVFITTSETFSQKNTNATIAETLDRLKPVIQMAKTKGLFIRGYISCVFDCPYEGAMPVDTVKELANWLWEQGCQEIALGDTIGMATVKRTKTLISKLKQTIPIECLAVHFHNTFGQGLANILASLQCGVSIVDSSAGGLGGCPYAPGATGNVATEDVLYLLDGLEIETHVDLAAVIRANHYLLMQVGLTTRSNVAAALRSKQGI